MNYEILSTELALPAYSAMTDAEAAAALNAVDISRIKSSMSGSDMFLATDATEFAALTADKKSEWIGFCGIDSHDPANNGVAHQFVNYIFGAGTTLTALAASRTEIISRATELGLGIIKEGEVQFARNL